MSSRRWIAAAGVLAGAGIAALVAWVWVLRLREPVLGTDWGARAFLLAGDGTPGTRDGSAAHARFSDPYGVAAAPDGTVFVADAGEAQAVRRISPDGVVSTIAGGFDTPSGIAVDASGVLYVADTANNAIRRVALDGAVTTLAEGFNGPIGVAIDPSGRVVVADTYNDRIRAIQPDGTVVDITQEDFDTPCGVAVDAAGNIYVAETGAGTVRMISTTGVVSTVAPLPAEGLFRPTGIAVARDGALYVTDDRGRIVEIRPGVSARTLIGWRPGFADGAGSAARLRGPTGVAVAEMAAKAQEISMEAGSKMAAAMKDVITAAAGLSSFAIESARDLVQYMVRRGQMTQDEADKLIREVEEAQSKRKGARAPAAAEKPAATRAVTAPRASRETAARPAKKAAPVKKVSTKPAAKAKARAAKPARKASAAKSSGAKKPAAKTRRR